MTENKGLMHNAQMEQSANLHPVDITEQQISALRALLNLPVAECNDLLAQQAAAIAEYFVPAAEEMEWIEEYVEDNNWDDD